MRIKVKAGGCREAGWVGWEGGRCWMGQVGLCTLFLTAGLAGPVKGRGAQSSRSETLKHQRERHYPERTRKHKLEKKIKTQTR